MHSSSCRLAVPPCGALQVFGRDLRTSNVGAKAIEKGIQGGGGIGFSGLEDLHAARCGARVACAARNKGTATRSKDATNVAPGITTSNKKLLGTRASLLGVM